jgi:ATP-binding cassette subfamily F protein uup
MNQALPPLLTSQQLAVRIGVTTLFEGLALTLHPGDRLGIIGPNGAGKSTLLRILADVHAPDQGHVAWRSGLRKAYVTQTMPFSKLDSVKAVIEEQLRKVYSTEALEFAQRKFDQHLEILATQPELGSDSGWLDELDKLQHTLDQKMEEAVDIPNALGGALRVAGLSHLSERSVGQLSGGQQKRLQLVHALLSQPQLLLLDEPTNHLDVETVEWLEEFLLELSVSGFQVLGVPLIGEYFEPIALAIVSHDRSLLDTLANRILEIADGDIQFYTGNYETYAIEKVRRMEEARTKNQRLANLMRRELSWLSRGPAARTTKQQARINRAASLEVKLQTAEQKASDKPKVALQFDAEMTSRARDSSDLWTSVQENLGSQVLLEISDLGIKHPGGTAEPRLTSGLSLKIKPNMRLAILGPNGSGKTHMLRVFAGQLAPDAGLCKAHDLIKISYFDQHRHELDFDKTVRATVCPDGDYVHTSQGYVHVMSYLERFLFARHDTERLLKTLSGGEQARVLMARMMLEQANTLILDEPTNDLDIPTLQGLEETLLNFAGGIVFTSHDRYFINRIATHILVYSGIETHASGSHYKWTLVADLEQALALLEKTETTQSKIEKELKKSTSSTNTKQQSPSEKQKLTFSEKKELQQLEARIEKLEHKIESASAQLNHAYTAETPFQELQALQSSLTELEAQLVADQERWEYLYSKLD